MRPWGNRFFEDQGIEYIVEGFTEHGSKKSKACELQMLYWKNGLKY